MSNSTLAGTLFVFIDESGNFDFSSKGTRHFVMAAVAALSPLESASSLQTVRYQLLAEGVDVKGFHATEDKQAVRDRVFAAIATLTNVKAHVIYGDKRRTAPALQSREKLHGLFSRALIRYVARAYDSSAFSQIVVIFDQALPKRGQDVLLASMKPELKAMQRPFRIYFHPMSLDFNGQLADYVSWSKFKELERQELRPWQALEASIGPSQFDIFRNSWGYYY